ncbi:unnamed protein product [Blepharisma stoltei]|uniref:Uncharacterized protein n=1 Tax=Blepharisma stoltei TaxID=1481888 RepID=A0AAU9JWX4_9CILI|nr:unnamed protein product [Blepharisma stoltei]
MEESRSRIDIDALIQKYKLEPSPYSSAEFKPTSVEESDSKEYEEIKKGRQLSFNESSSKKPENFQQSESANDTIKSKAITNAMKALQEKVNKLESEKDGLQAEIEYTKMKHLSEINELEEKYKNKAANLSEDSEGLSIQKLEEQVEFLHSQCEFAEAENKRLSEQYTIDKENWALQFEHLKRQINSKPPIPSNNNLVEMLKQEQTEHKKTLEQLEQRENEFEEVSKELEFYKKKCETQKDEYQKNFKYIEGELRRIKLEQEARIVDLENENKKYKELYEKLLLENQKRDYKKPAHPYNEPKTTTPRQSLDIKAKQAAEIKAKSKQTSDVKSTPKQVVKKPSISTNDKAPIQVQVRNKRENSLNSSNSKPLTRSSSVTKQMPSKQASSTATPGTPTHKFLRRNDSLKDSIHTDRSSSGTPKNHYKTPSYLKKNKENEASLETQIQDQEKDVSSLNARYKLLLHLSQDGNQDLSTIRNELVSISQSIDDKTKIIFSLKQRQQEIIKNKMLNVSS